jgi:tape measure domain-containing protein
MKQATKATREYLGQLSTKTLSGFKGELASLQKQFIAFVTVATLKEAVSGIVRAGLDLERLNRKLTVATGSTQAAAREYVFLNRTADELGLNLRAAADAYAGFAVSAQGTALEGQGVRDVFKSISGASVALGLSAEQTNGVFTALTQIMSKGRVQAEELVGQLGERLPGALSAAARGFGVTTAELLEMVQKGLVPAAEFVQKFAAQYEEEMGDAIAEGSDSAQASFNRLSNAWESLKQSLAEGGGLEDIKVLANSLAAVAKAAKLVSTAMHDLRGDSDTVFEDVGKQISIRMLGPLGGVVKTYDLVKAAAKDAAAQAQQAAQEEGTADQERIDQKNRLKQLDEEISKEAVNLAKLQKQKAEDVSQAEIKASEDALRAKERELAEGLRAEESYVRQIESLRGSLADTLGSDADRLRELRRRDMDQVQQQADIEKQAAEKIAEARRAGVAGDQEHAQALAEQAKSLAEQVNNTDKAVSLFKRASDVYGTSKAAEIQAAERALGAQIEANAETQKAIDATKGKLDSLNTVLEVITKGTKTIQIDADITNAEAKIKRIQAEIDQLSRSLGVNTSADGGPITIPAQARGGPITVPRFAAGGSLASAAQQMLNGYPTAHRELAQALSGMGYAAGGDVRELRAGLIRGPGTGTSDSILAAFRGLPIRVSNGEHAFITKQARARKLWPLLNTLNFGSEELVNRTLTAVPGGLMAPIKPLPVGPGYAAGGAVGGGGGSLQPVVLNLSLEGKTQTVSLLGERAEVERLKRTHREADRGKVRR